MSCTFGDGCHGFQTRRNPWVCAVSLTFGATPADLLPVSTEAMLSWSTHLHIRTIKHVTRIMLHFGCFLGIAVLFNVMQRNMHLVSEFFNLLGTGVFPVIIGDFEVNVWWKCWDYFKGRWNTLFCMRWDTTLERSDWTKTCCNMCNFL